MAKYLERNGEGIHHVGYRVDDCAAALETIKAHGARVIDEHPGPDRGARRWRSSIPKTAFGTLIELVQE